MFVKAKLPWVALLLLLVAAVQAGEPRVRRQKVENEVSCKDPIGARSYEEVKRDTDELRYLTRPKDGDRLSAKPSTVNDRRDVRVV